VRGKKSTESEKSPGSKPSEIDFAVRNDKGRRIQAFDQWNYAYRTKSLPGRIRTAPHTETEINPSTSCPRSGSADFDNKTGYRVCPRPAMFHPLPTSK
jgi:hypothetical protein